MNVIVSNKYTSMLETLDIEVIKRIEGEYDVEDIIDNLKNFYFNKLILDITSLKDYTDITVLQKLSVALDMDRLILLLDDSSELSSDEFISQLISIGIYNFAKNLEGITYLYNNPNTYRDVAHLHHLESKEEKELNGPSIIQHNIFVNNNTQVNPVIKTGPRIIGFKNVTKHAGSTSLIYMMKKELETYYNVLAVEVSESDFRFFNDDELLSATLSNISNIITKNMNKDIILIDINEEDSIIDSCDDVIYLLEPSIIKLNRLILFGNKKIEKLKDEKIVLNKSVLNSKDIIDFEFESKLKIYFNLPNMNDRELHNENLIEFLIKLGFIKIKKNVNDL